MAQTRKRYKKPRQLDGFALYMDSKLSEWQVSQPVNNSLGDFASYLGLNPAVVSQMVNGLRKPGIKVLRKLAEKLGPTVYDAAGIKSALPAEPLPSTLPPIHSDEIDLSGLGCLSLAERANLLLVIETWPALSDRQKDQIMQAVRQARKLRWPNLEHRR